MYVLDYLQNHTLDQLTNEFAIKVSQNPLYPELYILNYNQIDSPKTHPITVECRSLVLGSVDQGKTFFVVSRAFDRFFNYSENNYCPDISKLSCYEKLDGSLVSVFNYKGQWLYRTKGMLMPELTINGFDRTWKDLIEITLNWDELPTKFMSPDETYIFEVVSMENRVVVRYDEDAAVLLAIRNIDGDYLGKSKLPFNTPRKYSFNSTEECILSVKELPNLEEGYVAYDNYGVPVCKIKSPTYLACHRIKGEGLTPKRIRELVVINEQDEYLAVFPEDKKYFDPYTEAWSTLQKQCDLVMNLYGNVDDQKGFALAVKDYTFSGVLFQSKKSGVCPIKTLTSQSTSYKVKILESMMETMNE